MVDVKPDPGGRFASDAHRRVLGHLSAPSDDYGWTVEALLARMSPDAHTAYGTTSDLAATLSELEAEGYADQPQADIWRMTQVGFDVLTGENAPESAGLAGPARIDVPTPLTSTVPVGATETTP